MAKILTIGSVTKDMFFPVKGALILDTPEDLTAKKKIAFELGAKYDVRQRFETLGGCAVNVAAGVAKLGEDVSTYVGVGSDDCGKWILEKIAQEGIDASNVTIQEGSVSDLSTIIVDEDTGERTIFSNHGASRKLVVDASKIDNFKWVFIGDLSGQWKKNLDEVLAKVAESEICVAFNPRQQMLHDNISKVIDVISKCDVVFLNKDEATEVVLGMDQAVSENEIESEEYLVKKILATGVRTIVITDGVRGAWASKENQVLHIDGIVSNNVVDTTGAGDAFASGFLSAHIKGKNIAECLEWGIANSSSSISQYGGQAGLLDQEQISEYLQKQKSQK